MEKRSVGLAIVLSFVTCGIYALYWQYKMTEEAHYLVGRRTTASGGMAILYSLITCGIYGIYWIYKMGETLVEAKQMRGMYVDHNTPLLYILLAIFALGIVAEALMQSTINELIDADMNNSYGNPQPPMGTNA